jgi:ketosteroid isomerase-like protein
MTNNTQSEQEIREAIQTWGNAVSRKDLEAMHSHYTESYTLFDVKATVHGVEDSKKLWEQCFPFFDVPKIEYKDMVIHASDDMAIVHFRSRITGLNAPIPEEMKNSWLRGTCGLQKIDGHWKIVHEHISFPVDCMENKIIFTEF